MITFKEDYKLSRDYNIATCLMFDGKIYYIKDSKKSENSFFKYFGVKKNTYIGQVFQRLFYVYCKHSINLFWEYNKYYKYEFKTFEEYLYNKHNLANKEIEIFRNKNSFYKEYSKVADRVNHDLLFDETIKEQLYEFLGGVVYED